MFPGFKSTSQLKWTPQGLSLYMPVGTAAARAANANTSTGLNNITIGGGYNISSSNNTVTGNVLIGSADYINSGTLYQNQYNIATSNNTMIGLANTGASVLFAGGSNVLIGCSPTASVSSSICIGSNAQPATSGVTLGPSATSGGTYAIAIGSSAYAAQSNTIAIGVSTNANANYATAIGYSSSTAKTYSTAIGYDATTDYIGQTVFSSGAFASAGDITNGKQTLWTVTTDGTTSVLMGSGGVATAPTNYPLAVVNGTYLITGDLFAKTTAGGSIYSWSINTIVNVGASLSTIAYTSPAGYTGGVLASVGTYTGTAPTMNVNTTTGAFTIAVIGLASTTLRWAANLRITKITF